MMGRNDEAKELVERVVGLSNDRPPVGGVRYEGRTSGGELSAGVFPCRPRQLGALSPSDGMQGRA